jgi:hypothetical protein
MSYSKNYFNGIPTSVMRFGKNRQQYQSYDGVISLEKQDTELQLSTLEQQISALDKAITDIQTKLAGINVASGTLSCDRVSTNTIDAPNAAFNTETVVNQTISGDMTMNSFPLYLKTGVAPDNVKTMIQGSIYGPKGFCEVRGDVGGCLAMWKSGQRKPCMDWGDERIRSPKTFQAGFNTVNGVAPSYTVSISFPDTFINVPTVLCQIQAGAGFDYAYYTKVSNVTTSGFSVNKYYIDGLGGQHVSNDGMHWVAFDPTNTSIFP